MKKKTIITALLVLVALMTFGQGNNIADTYWRNEQTGDWQIGFADGHVIYNNKAWKIASQTEKKDTYTLTTDNGETIKVSKAKNGLRAITIGNGKPVVCSQITTKTLPDYPTKDTCTAFRDTHYQTDTVTLVGWLKDIPQAEKNEGNEFLVNYNNIFTGKIVSSYAKIDSLGHFVVKVPLLNTSLVTLLAPTRTNIRTFFEPGETYFLLCDFKTGHQLFMGKDSRVQNETLALPLGWLTGERTRGMDETALMRYFESIKNEKADLMAELRKEVEAHPTVSDRYMTYLTDYYRTCEGRELMQVTHSMASNRLPAAYLDYVGQQHWQRRVRPYTLFSAFSVFIKDYVSDLVADRYAIRYGSYILPIYNTLEPIVLRRYRDAGKLAITDEELAAVEYYVKEEPTFRISANSEETEKEIAEFEQRDYVKRYQAIVQREDVHAVLAAETPLFPVYQTLAILDSIGCDRDLRDIIITNKLYQILNYSRAPLSETAMQFFEENVTMPAAKSFLRAEQDKYLAIQRRATSKSASLKANNDLAGMSDGEKILRKIIEPYRGRLILLDVWGTWCGPCKEAMSHSKEEFERLKDYNLVYLYLANRSSDEAWKNVIKEYDLMGDDIVHYNLPAAQQSAIEHFLNVQGFPTYKLIDRDGTVLGVNADPRDLEGLARLLEKLK